MASERGATPRRVGRRIRRVGTTQGMGLRPWIHGVARELALLGSAINTPEGVEIEAWGSECALDALVERLRGAAAVEALDQAALDGAPPEPRAAFRLGSRASAGPSDVPLSPDRAVCARCLAEARDRRYGYPFTSCTACGPRSAIARALPWDRPRTSMTAFPPCAACQREHATPGDRRHHAEANACPRCGPRLFLATPDGDPWPDRRGTGDALVLETAARALRRGAILAVRGIGGYHIVCDATDTEAVARLRKRKGRARKPFAVMIADAAAARALAHIDAAEAALLAGPEAPVVLLRRRDDAPIAEGVAPGLPWLGLLLAYTPLHHLLLEGAARRLVASSANASGEPIAISREDAARLAPLVDGFLHHDREIAAPCDDSVARVFAGRARVLRRSRGFAPRPLALTLAVTAPVLGSGAQLAATVCLARGERAWPSPHLGDLGSPESAEAWERAVARLEDWVGARAEAIGHDLHPGYTSTRVALARDAALHVPVQHHHAHVASALAEHRLAGPVVGIVFDGTGLGSDGAAWSTGG